MNVSKHKGVVVLTIQEIDESPMVFTTYAGPAEYFNDSFHIFMMKMAIDKMKDPPIALKAIIEALIEHENQKEREQ